MNSLAANSAPAAELRALWRVAYLPPHLRQPVADLVRACEIALGARLLALGEERLGFGVDLLGAGLEQRLEPEQLEQLGQHLARPRELVPVALGDDLEEGGPCPRGVEVVGEGIEEGLAP